jgi:hypothetical protein
MYCKIILLDGDIRDYINGYTIGFIYKTMVNLREYLVKLECLMTEIKLVLKLVCFIDKNIIGIIFSG